MDVGRFASLRVSQAPGVLALEEEFHNVMQSLSLGENPVPSFLLALKGRKASTTNWAAKVSGLSVRRQRRDSRSVNT